MDDAEKLNTTFTFGGIDANKENYKEFELQFGPIPTNMKSELKSIVIDLEYN